MTPVSYPLFCDETQKFYAESENSNLLQHLEEVSGRISKYFLSANSTLHGSNPQVSPCTVETILATSNSFKGTVEENVVSSGHLLSNDLSIASSVTPQPSRSPNHDNASESENLAHDDENIQFPGIDRALFEDAAETCSRDEGNDERFTISLWSDVDVSKNCDCSSPNDENESSVLQYYSQVAAPSVKWEPLDLNDVSESITRLNIVSSEVPTKENSIIKDLNDCGSSAHIVPLDSMKGVGANPFEREYKFVRNRNFNIADLPEHISCLRNIIAKIVPKSTSARLEGIGTAVFLDERTVLCCKHTVELFSPGDLNVVVGVYDKFNEKPTKSNTYNVNQIFTASQYPLSGKYNIDRNAHDIAVLTLLESNNGQGFPSVKDLVVPIPKLVPPDLYDTIEWVYFIGYNSGSHAKASASSGLLLDLVECHNRDDTLEGAFIYKGLQPFGTLSNVSSSAVESTPHKSMPQTLSASSGSKSTTFVATPPTSTGRVKKGSVSGDKVFRGNNKPYEHSSEFAVKSKPVIGCDHMIASLKTGPGSSGGLYVDQNGRFLGIHCGKIVSCIADSLCLYEKEEPHFVLFPQVPTVNMFWFRYLHLERKGESKKLQPLQQFISNGTFRSVPFPSHEDGALKDPVFIVQSAEAPTYTTCKTIGVYILTESKTDTTTIRFIDHCWRTRALRLHRNMDGTYRKDAVVKKLYSLKLSELYISFNSSSVQDMKSIDPPDSVALVYKFITKEGKHELFVNDNKNTFVGSEYADDVLSSLKNETNWKSKPTATDEIRGHEYYHISKGDGYVNGKTIRAGTGLSLHFTVNELQDKFYIGAVGEHYTNLSNYKFDDKCVSQSFIKACGNKLSRNKAGKWILQL